MKAPSLSRNVFKTSRLAEFSSKKELVNQTGHAVEDWPLVVLKELVDNTLDSTEEPGIAPAVQISVSQDCITIADNGPGIAPETVADIIDYTARASFREAYVSPTRGAQGNALKTLLAMPFALDGERGETTIESRGVAHRITFSIDPIPQEPKITRVCEASPVKNGTRVAVSWPISTCSILDDAQAAFLRIAEDYTWVNPHLTLTVKWDRDSCDPVQWAIPATDPTWHKWRPSDPTSPHWYDVPRLARLIANNIAYAQDHGIPCRTIWDFVREFRGLSATVKAKAICDAADASRLSLTQFYGDGEGAPVGALLDAMRKQSRPVSGHRRRSIPAARRPRAKPGRDFNQAAGRTQRADHHGPAPGLPARRIFGSRQIECEPAMSSSSPAKAIAGLIEGVTEKWAKQRKAEERDASARARRNDRLIYYRRPLSLRDAAFRVMRDAYMAASANGTLPANARQIYYAARPRILQIAERDSLDSQYFCQTLLVDYMQACDDEWDVVWDDRGHFTEPHTGRAIGLGTLNVRNYLRGNKAPDFQEAGFSEAEITTHGPEGCFGAVLFIEKEGFQPLFEAANLAKKHAIAIMSSKGMSVTAARHLADRMCSQYKIPLVVLHDFDIAGFSISGTLRSDTRRYNFRNRIKVIDLGLRLTDVAELGLASETVSLGNTNPRKIRDRLRRNGATHEEIEFLLSGERVELNVMASDAFVAFVERKLTEAGIAKVVPSRDQIAEAYRLFARSARTEEAVKEAIDRLGDEEISVPDDVEARVRAYLAEHPDQPWDHAVRDATEEEGGQ